MTACILRLRPLPAGLPLVGMALAADVLIGFATGLRAYLFLSWAGFEAMAAFERWNENEVRFLR